MAEQGGYSTDVAMALSTVTPGAGGVLVPQNFATEIIEALRPMSVVRKMGTRSLPLNNGNLTMPRITGNTIVTYIGTETDIPITGMTFADTKLSAKKAAAIVPISNDLIANAGINPRIDDIVVNDLAVSMGLSEDLHFIRADGTGTLPKRRIVDISKSDIELFQAQLLKQGLAPKTVNDIFTVVRGVWADAFGDGILKANPLDRISNVGSDVDLEHADPFSRTEIDLIGKSDPDRRADTRMIEFNCWAGLSLSELIGLAVEDVDLEAGLVHVRRASVVGEFKVPKERSRVRVVELIDPALELMRQIVAAAKDAPTIEITVIQRDNITSKKMKVRFLFHSSTSGLLWSGKTLSNWFTAHLKKAEVRHRGANQCRHTFASQMLSSYVPVEWVARQLGHADTTMVRKHYGRWIPKDTKSMAGIVSKMLGFREE